MVARPNIQDLAARDLRSWRGLACRPQPGRRRAVAIQSPAPAAIAARRSPPSTQFRLDPGGAHRCAPVPGLADRDRRHAPVGAQTAAQAAAEPWTLSDTQGFVDRARAEAAPPAPMTTPAEGDTDAFVREMIRRATPPPRAKH